MTSKKKILFLSPYPINVAPSQRLKYEQYYNCFTKNGWELESNSFISEDLWMILYKNGYLFRKVTYLLSCYLKRFYKLFSLTKYDIVYIHLWATPIGFPIFEWLVCKLNRNIIYDIDDMVFLGHSSSANKLIEKFKGKNKMIYLMKKAKHVIVCTPKLHDFVAQYNQNLTDISSTINTDTYQVINNYSNNKKIVLGWSGSHSTSKYLLILEPVLQRLKKEFEFDILVIGDRNFKFNELQFNILPWNAETEVRDLQKIDIGLYPLPNEEWVYGKSGLKALQYMALGIPTVATAIGANFRVIEDEVSGFLVTSEDEWYKRLKLLIANETKRKEIGLMARKRVEKYYSINASKGTYLSIFDKVL